MGPVPLQFLIILVGTVLPIVTGLVSKASWSSGSKAVILLALSALTGLGSEAIVAINQNDGYDLVMGAVLAFGTFLAGVGTHFGLLRPVGIAESIAHKGVKD